MKIIATLETQRKLPLFHHLSTAQKENTCTNMLQALICDF